MVGSHATGPELAGPLRVLWDGGVAAGAGDGPLLARFAAGCGPEDEGAEAAFGALIGRHGPMVLRVCSGLLGDRHAAEDAFQAVFLVLARRAGSIRHPDRLAPWLHGVALRVAREARSRERRRAARDRAVALEGRAEAEAGSDWPGLPIARREASEALHAAIGRLPGRYRDAVILCDLEGLGVVEAASRLGCPASTLGVRLMRGRRALRDKLEGREPGLLAAPPLVPAALAGATARRAARFAASQGAAGSALAAGARRALGLARTWKVAGVAIALGAGLVAGGWAAARRPAMAAPARQAGPVVAGQDPAGPVSTPRAEPAAPTLDVARAVAREVRDYADYIGRTEASRSVEVRARVGGTLEKAEAREGATVKAGDVLFSIDPRPFEIQRDVANAQLDQARARRSRAGVELSNSQKLRAGAAISQRELDLYIAAEQEAEAGVRVAEAGVKRAVLDLEAATVRAPFDGEVARRLAEAGATVRAGEPALAVLVATDPIAVTFELAESTFLSVRRLVQAGKMAPEIPIRIALADEPEFSREVKFRIDGGRPNAGPGTFRQRAEFPNADRALVPGLFVRIRMEIGPPHPALLVPESAVLSDQGRKSLRVLGAGDAIEDRPVVVGNLHGDLREVREGLAAGERFLVRPQKYIRPLTILPDGSAGPSRP